MAEAVRETVTTIVESDTVVLTLTVDEAATLYAITGKIGGLPKNGSRRGHADAIRKALGRAGIATSPQGARASFAAIGTINFEDEEI